MYTSSNTFPTKSAAIRQAIETKRTWIEKQLGVPLSGAVLIEIEVNLTQIGVEAILGRSEEKGLPTRTLRRLRTLVGDTKMPVDVPPILEFGGGVVRDELSFMFGGPEPKRGPHFQWTDTPIALRFHLGGIVLVAINVPY
jgi:hypothetical protein